MFARGGHTISQLADIYGLDEKSVRSLLRARAWLDSPTFENQLREVMITS